METNKSGGGRYNCCRCVVDAEYLAGAVEQNRGRDRTALAPPPHTYSIASLYHCSQTCRTTLRVAHHPAVCREVSMATSVISVPRLNTIALINEDCTNEVYDHQKNLEFSGSKNSW